MKISAKLIAGTVIPTFIILLCIAALGYITLQQLLSNSAQDQQYLTADRTLDDIDHLIFERVNDVNSIAANESHRNTLSNRTAEDTVIFLRMTQVTGPWNVVRLFDLNSNIIDTTRLDKLDAASRDYLVDQPAIRAGQQGKSYYSDAVMGRSNDRPIIVVAAPVFDYSKPLHPVIGVVVAHMSWEAILQQLTDHAGPRMQLINSAGMLLADTYDINKAIDLTTKIMPVNKAKLIYTPKSIKVESVVVPHNKAPQRMLVSFAPEAGYAAYHGNNWGLFVSTPTKVVFASVVPEILRVLSPITILVLIVAVLSYIFIHVQIVRPLTRLHIAARKIAAGNLSLKVNVRGDDEIGLLGAAFNTMASRLAIANNKQQEQTEQLKTAYNALRLSNANIEKTVAARTHELQVSQARLTALIDGLDVGVYLLDANMNVVIASAPMQKIFKRVLNLTTYSNEQITKRLTEFPKFLEDINKCIKTRKPVLRNNYELRGRVYRAYCSPVYEDGVKNGKLTGIVVLFDDITDSRNLDRSRDEFFSIASHELRTPLTAIRGNTAMIQQFYAKQLSEEPDLQEMVSDIHDSSIRLITIVNDFLTTSRLEQGKMEFKFTTFNINDLIEEVTSEFKAGGLTEKVGIVRTSSTSTAKLPEVTADRDRLKEVVLNLVGNALKFSDAGKVTIDLKLEHDYVMLRVCDTGKGIPEDSQHLLFRKFQQASNNIYTRDSSRSTGLGLYISKLIMQGMNGDVTLEHSEVGKGSTFLIKLPVSLKTT